MSSATLPPPPAASPWPRPGVLPEDVLTEVVNGEVVEKVVSIQAARIAGRLNTRLDTYLEGRGLGTVVPEAMFVLDPAGRLKRRPDVAFVPAERWPVDRPVPDEGDWEIAPDLAVEVVSPGDTYNEVEEKVEQWLGAGTRAVWIVKPRRRSVTIYRSMTDVTRLSESDELDGGEVVPGFRCKVSEIFV